MSRCALGLLLALYAVAQSRPEELCAIGGRVRSISGEPLRGVLIQLTPADGSTKNIYATTPASGEFTVPDLAPGRYRVRAEKSGFLPQEFGARGPGRGGVEVAVAAGQTRKDVELAMSPQGVITGRILDEEGEPAVNASVGLLRRGFYNGRAKLLQTSNAQTNDLGEYRMHGVSPGRYVLRAMGTERRMWVMNPRDGQSVAPTYYPGVTSLGSAAAIDVGVGASVQGVDVQLKRARSYRVRGKVLGIPEGSSGGTVELESRNPLEDDTERISALHGETSPFEVSRVPPGSYILRAFFSGGPGRVTASGFTIVEVASEDLDNVTVPVLPALNVTGIVRTEGAPLESLKQVHLTLESRRHSLTSNVKTDGTISFENATTDHYALRLLSGGDLFLKSARLGEIDVLEQGLDLTRGATGPLTIVMSGAGARVEGTVTDGKGQPVPDATVILHPGAGHPRTAGLVRVADTDPSGKYTLAAIAPGSYLLFAVEEREMEPWMDPDFVKKHQPAAQSLELREGAKESRGLRLP